MAQVAEKAALVEWINDLGLGSVRQFSELVDGGVVRQVVAKVTGCPRPVKDFADANRAIADALGDEPRRRLFRASDLRGFEKPTEAALLQLLGFVLLVAVECSEKNTFIARIMKLSSSTQRVIMQLIQKMHEGVEQQQAAAASAPGTYVLDGEDPGGTRAAPRLQQGGSSSSSSGAATSSEQRQRQVLEERCEQLQRQLEQARTDLRRTERERDDALHEVAVEHASERERDKTRAQDREQELQSQVTTLRDECDLLRARVEELQKVQKKYEALKKQQSDSEDWRERFEEMRLLYESTKDTAAGGRSDGIAQQLRADVEKLREQVKRAEVERARAEEKLVLAQKKQQDVEQNLRENQLAKEMLETEVTRLRQGEAGESSSNDESLQQEALRDQLKRYRAQVAALKQALESVKAQLLENEQQLLEKKEGTRAGQDEDPNITALQDKNAELQKKLMDAYNQSVTEREKALKAMGDAADLSSALAKTQDQNREYEQRVAKFEKLLQDKEGNAQDKEGAAGTTVSLVEHADALDLLRDQLESERKQWQQEQQLMASTFHEVGLRYHQLLSEYKHVLRETGRADTLFSTAA
ncbi:unnamed protein product [Amoebophrya sp. A120]|nr:unnamed protein product [Amoebophrya sp. A120]|eukprot:GSA120T00017540001.1